MENPAGRLEQRLAGAVLFQHHRRGAGLLQNPGVFLLVVVGHIGRRHNHRRDPQSRQLADGGGAGPAQHQVCRPHHQGHVINVLPHLEGRVVLQVHALFLQQLQKRRITALTGPVDMVVVLLRRIQGQKVRHLPVHAGGTQ